MKKRRTNKPAKAKFCLCLIAVILPWGFQVSAEEWTDAQKEVWNSVKAGWELILKGDLDTLSAKFTEDVHIWWPSQPKPFGKDQMRIRYGAWFSWNKPVSYELEAAAINIMGDVSTVFYSYKWVGDKQPETVVSGRVLETFIKQKGKWKFVGSMGCSCDTTPICY